MTRAFFCCATLLSRLAVAAPPPPAAEEARQQAVQLANAARWEEALASINQALELAPDWGEAYFLRAGIEARALSPVGLRDLEGEPDSFPFRQYAVNLEAASKDLRRYLDLTPDAPEAQRTLSAADAMDTLAAVARRRQARLDERHKAESALTGKRLAATRTEIRSEKERNLTVARGLGVGLVGLSAVLVGVMAVMLVDGANTNQHLRAGGFQTGSQCQAGLTCQQSELNAGQNDNQVALGFGIGAGLSAASGVIAWLLGNNPPSTPPKPAGKTP